MTSLIPFTVLAQALQPASPTTSTLAFDATGGSENPEPTKEECISAHRECQEARADGRLLLAWSDANVCTNQHCPAPVVSDCAVWRSDLDRRIPSLVFEVVENGQLNTSAKIEVDGAVVERWTHGEPLRVDIGQHQVKVELPPYSPVARTVVLAVGMRFKLVSLEMRVPQANPTIIDTSSKLSVDESLRSPRRPTPIIVYPLAGLSVIALGTFAGFTLSGNAEYDRLARSCSPFCAENDVDRVRSRYLVANISLGVAAVALASAGTFYLTRPRTPSSPALGVVPTQGGAMANVALAGY